jgi:hypothetical protein
LTGGWTPSSPSSAKYPLIAATHGEFAREGGVPAEDAVPGRDDACGVRALDFIARLAALVPRPRVNLTRYHGVLAPNHRWRAEVTPAGRGRRNGKGGAQPEKSVIERHAAMTCTHEA